MKLYFHRNTLPFRNIAYFKGGGDRSFSFLKQHPHLCDCIVLLFAAGLLYGFISYFSRYNEPLQAKVEIDLSPFALPKYTFFSLSRGLLAYSISLLISLLWGFWAAKDRLAERFLIPLLDVIQCIPILGFMPALILLFIGLFPNENVGLELAAILVMFMGEAWNMAFGIYHSIRIIPQDKIDCAVGYRLSNWQRIKWLDMPYTVLSLVWNSIMSVASGWFFLMVNEAFKLGDRDFQLPGLGSYMSVAAQKGNVPAMISAILAMIVLIVFLDYFLWRPLVAWSQKFRVEETGSMDYTDSLFLQVLRHSFLIAQLGRALHFIGTLLPNPKKIPSPLLISRLCLFILLASLFTGLVTLFGLIREISFDQWIHLAQMTLFTLGRVASCVIVGTLITLPLGLMIGLSEKFSKKLEPVIQVGASFPATLLFPLLILLFFKVGISLNFGSIILMLLGTLWYILFNVLAGVKAMPSDLKEAATAFRWKKTERFFHLYLPSIFPYLVTGFVTAAGGAWSTSIVAEYISYNNQILTVPGIGSTISLSAQNGDIPLLAASLVVMAVVVAVLNYQGWLRLYHYSEKRFSLNY